MKLLVVRVSMVLIFLMAFGVFSAPAQEGPEQAYIVLANNAGHDLGEKIAAAGGTMTSFMPQIRAATAVSSNPNFAEDIAGVRSVIPDRMLQYDMPASQGEFVGIDAVGDPPFSGSEDLLFDLQWGHNAVRAQQAWAHGVRGQGVRVAVLDGGFDLTHPDLVPNINFELSRSFVPDQGLEWGLVDPRSHGTHVAGIIAAAQNDFGIIGVAPDAELLLVKVLRDGGTGAFSWLAEGILYATDAGADVINMSLGALLAQSGICVGAPGVNCVTPNEIAEFRVLMNRVTSYAYQQGVTIIAGAGNNGFNRDFTADLLFMPADMPHVISISATTPIGWAVDPLNTFLDNPASYSNYGRSAIDFAAPGGDILYIHDERGGCTISRRSGPCPMFDQVFSTGAGGWYWSTGTSMATPHAAGIAALIISENGGSMHPAQVEAEMRRRAVRIGSDGRDPFYGMGRVSSGY